jgi:hypothetical protein
MPLHVIASPMMLPVVARPRYGRDRGNKATKNGLCRTHRDRKTYFDLTSALAEEGRRGAPYGD